MSPQIDGGPAGHACTCGEIGRYAYGMTRTARCFNPECPVIAYHARPAPISDDRFPNEPENAS